MNAPIYPLSEVTDLLTDGTHYTPPNIGQGVPFLTVKDLSEDGLDFEGCSKIALSEFEAAKRQNSAPQLGDILFSKDGTVGKVHLVREDRDFAVLSSLAILRPSIRVDSSYLAHFLRAPSTIATAAKKKTGSAIRRIVLRDLSTLGIPLPPLDEQRRISAILDKANALRQKRKRAIGLLDGLATGVFRSFAGRKYRTKTLGELCSVVRGSSPRPQGDPRYFGGDIPRLMIADITRDGKFVTPKNDSLTEEGAKKSRPMLKGDVVMAVSGAVGLPAILARDACIHDGFVGFRNLAPSIHPIFLYHHLLESRARSQAQGTGAIWTNLTTDQVKAFDVPLLPLELQAELVRRLDVVETQGENFRHSLAKLDDLASSLMRTAFGGEQSTRREIRSYEDG